MKRILFFVSVLFIITACVPFFESGKIIRGNISADEAYKILAKHSPDFFSQKDLEIEKEYSPICAYELFIPKKYNKENKHAVLLSFSRGIKEWSKVANKHNFIFAKADCSTFLMAALRQRIIETYSIDETKVFLTGFSAGAYRSADLIFHKPNDYAGAILASGGSLPPQIQNLSLLKNKRFYITLGQNDYAENIESARELEKYLKQTGAQVLFRLEPNSGHQYPSHRNREMTEFVLR